MSLVAEKGARRAAGFAEEKMDQAWKAAKTSGNKIDSTYPVFVSLELIAHKKKKYILICINDTLYHMYYNFYTVKVFGALALAHSLQHAR